MRKRTLLFRVDASDSIGIGHLRECIWFAEQVPVHAHFCILQHSYSIALVQEHGFAVTAIPQEERGTTKEIRKINGLIDRLQPDVLVIDLLDVDQRYLDALDSKGRCLAVLNAIRHPIKADVQATTVCTPHRKNRQYSGPEYIFLREKFSRERPHPARPAVQNILVMFGSADNGNLTLKTLKALSRIQGNFHTTIVLGGACRHRREIEEYLRTYSPSHRLMINISREEQMIRIMRKADLAIVSGGYTIAELMHLGIPCIALSQNRTEETNVFKNFPQDALVNLGRGMRVSQRTLLHAIRRLMKNGTARRRLGKRGASVVDGKGIERFYKILGQYIL